MEKFCFFLSDVNAFYFIVLTDCPAPGFETFCFSFLIDPCFSVVTLDTVVGR